MTTKMPETLEELNALITERILLFMQRLEMDGRLLPDGDGPKYGYTTKSRVPLPDSELVGKLPAFLCNSEVASNDGHVLDELIASIQRQ